MIKKEWMWMYFNDEWNQPDDEEDDDETTYVDGVDERPIKKEVEYKSLSKVALTPNCRYILVISPAKITR